MAGNNVAIIDLYSNNRHCCKASSLSTVFVGRKGTLYYIKKIYLDCLFVYLGILLEEKTAEREQSSRLFVGI